MIVLNKQNIGQKLQICNKFLQKKINQNLYFSFGEESFFIAANDDITFIGSLDPQQVVLDFNVNAPLFIDIIKKMNDKELSINKIVSKYNTQIEILDSFGHFKLIESTKPNFFINQNFELIGTIPIDIWKKTIESVLVNFNEKEGSYCLFWKDNKFQIIGYDKRRITKSDIINLEGQDLEIYVNQNLLKKLYKLFSEDVKIFKKENLIRFNFQDNFLIIRQSKDFQIHFIPDMSKTNEIITSKDNLKKIIERSLAINAHINRVELINKNNILTIKSFNPNRGICENSIESKGDDCHIFINGNYLNESVECFNDEHIYIYIDWNKKFFIFKNKTIHILPTLYH